MMFLICFGVYLLLLVKLCSGLYEVCDRRPLGTKTEPLLPDNQFVLEIEGIRNDKYIPENNYTVHLHARDGKSPFIAFTISLKEDYAHNSNSRKPTLLQAGRLELEPNTSYAILHKSCNNTVIQSDITAKTSVKAKWIAPGKENKCVTIFAVVAVSPNIWYSFEGPLSKKVCEDPRKDDDMPPMENDNCQTCEDARYELAFQGMWLYNTHLDLYPRNSSSQPRFSDIVGASHNELFTLYKMGSEATDGLQMLAEQGNTTGLEIEIEGGLGITVRTVIKATSPPQPHMVSITQFRASPEFHRLSIATAIQPSPDWFLGVSNMELCSTITNTWSEMITLNLYPLDAGTDQGINFNSANEVTLPHQAISLARIGGKDQVNKPFARLILSLIRTYTTPKCIELEEQENSEKQAEGEGDDNGDDGDDGDEENSRETENNHRNTDNVYIYTEPVKTTSEEPPSVDPESSEECPMSPWEEWMPCEGQCIDNKVVGFKLRLRYHMVDGVAVGKYENGPSFEDKKVPQRCLDEFSDTETDKCEEPCEAEAVEDDEDAEE